MGISAGVMLGISAAASIGSAVVGGVEGSMAAASRTQALQQQMKEVESQTRAKQISHLRNVNETMGRQMVIGAANGYDLSSGSFNAVTKDTMDKYEEDENADLLSENYQKEAIDQQISNAKSAGTMSVVQGVIGAAGSAANLFGNKLFSSASSPNASQSMGQVLQSNEMAEVPGSQSTLNNAMSQFRQRPLFQPLPEI
tara:strand:- start:2745 stop:3338 length:594 start_codon:yes stop_codon:yes gene_type:complete